MIIYSFDCGSVNMGVCVIEYNNLSNLSDLSNLLKQINMFKKNMNKKNINLNELKNILKNTSNFLDNIIKILYIDLVRLIDKVDKDNKKIVSNRLKYYLETLEYNFPKPDKVLIESQFLTSSLSCLISHQIQYHYSKYDNNINLLNKNYILKLKTLEENNLEVIIVGPSLKNSIDFDKNNSYANIQLSSFSNYQVNKKHSIKQFLYLINLFNQNDCIKNFNKKLADIADAYMMTINYIFKYLKGSN
jgi:hypothetical protein